MTINRKRFLRCERGAAAVEFALIAIPLIMVTIGTIETGRALWIRNDMAQNADRVERSILIAEKAAPSDEKPLIKTAAGRGILKTKLKANHTSATVGTPFTETISGSNYWFSIITVTQSIDLLIPFWDDQPAFTMTVQRKVPVPTEAMPPE